jgi:hypothetical protein
MLSDLRNCFRGRINGFEGRRVWLPIGDPLVLEVPFMLPNGLVALGGPMIDTDGLLADCGRRSCGGDSIKHSPSDIDVDVDNLLLPAPKRKGGNWSGPRVGKELVEKPFVLVRDGRSNIDFLRLRLKISCH